MVWMMMVEAWTCAIAIWAAGAASSARLGGGQASALPVHSSTAHSSELM